MENPFSPIEGRDTGLRPRRAVWPTVVAGVAGAVAFAALGSAVSSGGTRDLDEAVLRALRSPSDPAAGVGPVWLPVMMRDATSLGSTFVLTVVFVLLGAFLALQRKYREVAWLSGVYGGGLLLNWGLKRIYARPRPSVVSHLDTVSNGSYPSGHTLLATVVYCAVGLMLAQLVRDRKTKTLFFGSAAFLAFVVGLTRVYLGVHYPTDVAGGWIVGLVWALICREIWAAVARWKETREAAR